MRKDTQIDVDKYIKNSIIKDNNGCWIWTKSFNNSKQPQIGPIYIKRKYKTHLIRRISFMFYITPKIGKNSVIIPTCKNEKCINPEHLKKLNKGEDVLFKRRELTKKVYNLLNLNLTYNEIAKQLNISYFQVRNIVEGKVFNNELTFIKPYTKAKDKHKEVLKLFDKNVSPKKIADKLNLKVMNVYKILNRRHK